MNSDLDRVTKQFALQQARRLLLNAEMITDLNLMQRTESLADSWIRISESLEDE